MNDPRKLNKIKTKHTTPAGIKYSIWAGRELYPKECEFEIEKLNKEFPDVYLDPKCDHTYTIYSELR